MRTSRYKSVIGGIPPDLEEILAKTVGKVISRGGFQSHDLKGILDTVFKAVNLESEFAVIVANPQWIESFRERWAHKLMIRTISDSTPIGESTRSAGRFITKPFHDEKGSDLGEPVWKTQDCCSNKHGDSQHFAQARHSVYPARSNILLDVTNAESYHKLHCSPSRENLLSRAYSETCCGNLCIGNRLGPEPLPKKRMFLDRSKESEIYDWDSSTSVSSDWSDCDLELGPMSTKRMRTKQIEPCKISENNCSFGLVENSVPSNDSSRDTSKNKRETFTRVCFGELNLETICLACGTTKGIEAKHPLFLGRLCREHKLLFHERFFKYDADGYHSYCSVCCMGNKVILCDVQDCGRCYCKECLNILDGLDSFENAVKSQHWICNFCRESQDSLLQKRVEWQEEIQRLYQNTGDSKFPPFPVPSPIPVHARRPIRVLSLFDGIAAGVVALKQLGLEVERFVASEIDEDAIRVVQNKHPEVIHIGDITKLSDDEIYDMGPFDLLLGGSPCNDLSGANPRRKGLLDAEGSGCLFFDLYRVLRTIQSPREKNGRHCLRPFFWLFENVVSMKGIEKQRISRFLQCEPRMADARYVSAAARPRLFWGNLPGLADRKFTPGLNDRLTVQECLEPGRKASVEKLNTITTKFTCLYQGQARQAPVVHDGKKDILWTTEVERVFGVPEHYTDVNNLGPRERLTLLGRSWSVPVARLLLSPLKEYFAGVQPKVAETLLAPNASWWS